MSVPINRHKVKYSNDTDRKVNLVVRKDVFEYDAIATIVTTLGSSNFPEALIRNLNQIVEINHLSLVHLEDKEQITYVLSASTGLVEITPAMQQLYLSIYHRVDPNKEFINGFNDDDNDNILIRRLQPQEIQDQKYRKLWYEKMGIIDRLSILTKADRGVYCINLFRTQSPFSQRDIKILSNLSDLLCALTIKQARLAGVLSNFMTRETQIETLMERLAKIDIKLTKREKEVCARILLGMSSEGIALDLKIKTQSVLTYRKRSYARLNISSQNELFGLCLTTS